MFVMTLLRGSSSGMTLTSSSLTTFSSDTDKRFNLSIRQAAPNRQYPYGIAQRYAKQRLVAPGHLLLHALPPGSR